MPTFDEEKIRFHFGERWQVGKWDKCVEYVHGVGTLSGELSGSDGRVRTEGTKAVDFVGVLDDKTLYLFEVKDFRGHPVENKKRQTRDLPLEIGLKVRDSLAGLIATYSKGTKAGGTAWVDRSGQVLAERKQQVRVVAWIAEDDPRPQESHGKRAARASVRFQQIRQKLSWLTARVKVEDPFASGVPDASAENLPGAGRR